MIIFILCQADGRWWWPAKLYLVSGGPLSSKVSFVSRTNCKKKKKKNAFQRGRNQKPAIRKTSIPNLLLATALCYVPLRVSLLMCCSRSSHSWGLSARVNNFTFHCSEDSSHAVFCVTEFRVFHLVISFADQTLWLQIIWYSFTFRKGGNLLFFVNVKVR